MNNKLWTTVILAIGLMGCAAVDQARQDIQLAKADPTIVASVNADAEAAGDLAGTFLPVAANPVALITGTALLWYKGRRKRKGLPHSTTPITSYVGGGKGLEGLVQTLANLSSGVFNWGEGPTKRAAKFAMVGAVALSLLPIISEIPIIKNLLVENQDLIYPLLIALGSAVASVEKALGRVLPVNEDIANGGPETTTSTT